MCHGKKLRMTREEDLQFAFLERWFSNRCRLQQLLLAALPDQQRPWPRSSITSSKG